MKILLMLLLLATIASAKIVRLEDGHQYIKETDYSFGSYGYGFLAHSGACDVCEKKRQKDKKDMIGILKRMYISLKDTTQ